MHFPILEMKNLFFFSGAGDRKCQTIPSSDGPHSCSFISFASFHTKPQTAFYF